MIDEAVARSRTIAEILLGNGVMAEAGALVQRHFGTGPVRVVSDENTRLAVHSHRDILDLASLFLGFFGTVVAAPILVEPPTPSAEQALEGMQEIEPSLQSFDIQIKAANIQVIFIHKH